MVPEIAARHYEQLLVTTETCIATIAARPRFRHIFFGIHSGKTEDFVNTHGKGRRQKGGGGGTPILGTAMSRLTGYGFASLSLEQGLQISILSGTGYNLCPFRLWNTVGVRATFFLSESRCKQTVSVPARVPLHTQARHFQFFKVILVSRSGTGYLFSTFCREQGSKIVYL